MKTKLLIFISLFFCLKTEAQTAVAQVSSKQVQVGVPFEYAIVVSGNATECTPPNFNGFDVVSGPNQSSSTQIINGAVSMQLTLTWALVAKKEGKYTLGVGFVKANGQTIETKPISIEVTKGAPAQHNQSGGGNSKVSGGDVFIRTNVSKTKCFIGDQITISQKVYSRYEIVGFQKFSALYDGFYSLPGDPAFRPQGGIENVDGINYYAYELFKTNVLANKEGKFNLSSIEGDVIVRRQNAKQPKTVWEQFFGVASFEDIPVACKSRGIAMDILPLPEDGKPENFSGAVGNFNAKVDVSRKELKANDAFNLKINVSGRGNLKLINAPKITLPAGFETYEPKVIENANGKTFDYLVIPRNEGDYELNNIDFSYFNLESKKYVTIPSGIIKIKVLPGEAGSGNAQVFAAQKQIKESENDIRYIKKGNFELSKSDFEYFNSFTHLFLIALPILLLVIALVFRNSYVKSNSNLVLVNQRKAAKMAKAQLVKAEKLLQKNSKDEFYTEILLALQNYLSRKLNISTADISKENISSVLQQKKIEAQLINTLISTLETSEFAKYSPGAVSGDLQKVYSDTSELIVKIEEQLNKNKA